MIKYKSLITCGKPGSEWLSFSLPCSPFHLLSYWNKPFLDNNPSIPYRVPCVFGLSGKRTLLSKIAGTLWIHVSGVQDERGGEAPCTTDPGIILIRNQLA
jgi:hypothetical protein